MLADLLENARWFIRRFSLIYYKMLGIWLDKARNSTRKFSFFIRNAVLTNTQLWLTLLLKISKNRVLRNGNITPVAFG
jgi:hypothetical protein